MTPDEIHKLLGGYATGTLTAEERQALFAAALDDQELFDTLAKEQPLHDLLRDPAARAHLLAAIEEPVGWWQRWGRWTMAGGAVAALLAVTVGIYMRPKPAAQRVYVADVRPATAPAPAAAIVAPPKSEPLKAESPKAEPSNAEPPKAELSKAETAPVKELQAKRKPAAPVRDAIRQFTPPAPPPPAPAAIASAAPAPPVVLDSQPTADARTLFYAPPALNQVKVEAQSQLAPSAQSGAGGGAQFRESEPSRLRLKQEALQAAVAGVVGFTVPNPGVKWTALRKGAEGLFSEVDPDQLKAGDTVKLRLVPNNDGFLSVTQGSTVLLPQTHVVRLLPIETPEITGAVEGRKDLTIVLHPPTAQQPSMLIRPIVATDQVTQADKKEHSVYQVTTGRNQLAPVQVRVVLRFQ